MPESIRLLLIDDHRRVHEAVALVLETVEDIILAGQGSNGLEAVQLCRDLKPDMILMDVIMPGMGGIEATRTIHEQFPAIKILVLSSFQDDETIRAMMENGAAGYLLKGTLAQDLIPTIRATFAGQAVFSQEIAQNLLKPSSPSPPLNFDLTDRELEVLTLMGKGMNNGEIAAALLISQSTVKFHLTNILLKIQVETRAEAIVLAAKNNLI